MNDIVIWIENHPTSVSALTSAAIVFVAWLSGAFAFLQCYRRKLLLEIADTASIVFLELIEEFNGRKNLVRAALVINASVVNASSERVVVDHFLLSFRTYGIWQSHKQKLVRIAFPSRPRKRRGKGTKHMSVWFTQYPEEDV